MQNETFEYTQSVLAANIWQYEPAVPFLDLLRSKDAWYNAHFTGFWDQWYWNVFNLAIDYDLTNTNHTKVNLFGCSVWAIILNVPLEPILVPRVGQKQPWAFEDIGATTPSSIMRQNFGDTSDPAVSPFLGGNFTPASATIGMTMLEKVQLLKLAYYRNIGNCSIPFLNAMLKDVFQITGLIHTDVNGAPSPITQTPWAEDCQYAGATVEPMVLNYHFPYPLRDPLINALKTYDIMPHPSGVAVNMVYNT